MCRFYKEYLGRPYCVCSSVLLVCFPWLVCEPPEGRNSLLLPEAPTARLMQVSRTDQVSPQVSLVFQDSEFLEGTEPLFRSSVAPNIYPTWLAFSNPRNSFLVSSFLPGLTSLILIPPRSPLSTSGSPFPAGSPILTLRLPPAR